MFASLTVNMFLQQRPCIGNKCKEQTLYPLQLFFIYFMKINFNALKESQHVDMLRGAPFYFENYTRNYALCVYTFVCSRQK